MRDDYRPPAINEILALMVGPPWGGEFEDEAAARAAYDRWAEELEEIRQANGVAFWFDEESEND